MAAGRAGLVNRRGLVPWAATDWLASGSFLVNAKQVVPAVFEKFPKIMEITSTGLATSTDVKGHSSVGKFIMVRFSRENSATIDWENIAHSNLMIVADDHYQHR
jgi:hypothetical protein